MSSMWEPSDGELVSAIVAGDRAAMASLYDRYAATLQTLAERFMGNRTDAEDLIHDLFIEVWQQAHSYDEKRGSVRTWLLLRTRSRALDRLRSAAWRLSAHSAPTSAGRTEDLSLPVDEDLARRATAERMRSAVLVLSAEEQGLIDLIYVKGCSLQEAAGQLETPLGTVKSRLSRVLGKLRHYLHQPANEV
jgi:RNA polymerase sigma-70 factor (ECF subfamily)